VFFHELKKSFQKELFFNASKQTHRAFEQNFMEWFSMQTERLSVQTERHSVYTEKLSI